MRLPLLVVGLLLLTSCGTVGGNAGATDGDSVAGRTFLSVSVREAGQPRQLVEGTQVRLGFTGTEVSAQAGCNGISGSYRVVDGALVVEGTRMTEMGCDDRRHEQDTWLAEFLEARPAVRLAGEELVLSSGRTELRLLDRVVADPDRPLTEGRWVVDSITTGEVVATTPQGAEASLEFLEDGTLQVDAGCNKGTGQYTVDGAVLRVGAVALTRMHCEGPRGELEQQVMGVLNQGDLVLRIEAARLTVSAGDRGLGLRQQ